MQVTFRIYEANSYVFPSTGTLVKSYTKEAVSHKDVHNLFQECRQVWEDCMVEAEVDGYVQSSSHTYRNEVYNQLAEENRRYDEQELQWEYMNGAYSEEDYNDVLHAQWDM